MRSEKIITSAYGSIGHLGDSKMGEGDKRVHEGQSRICLEKKRDKHDRILVHEKVDGTCVAVVKLNGKIIPVSRSGYEARTSSYIQHHKFADFVENNQSRFDSLLKEGERICGEWMLQAHGIMYRVPHEPFVAFDIMNGIIRVPYDEFKERTKDFIIPRQIHDGDVFSLDQVKEAVKTSGHGGEIGAEGAVYRVERKGVIDFLAKWVRGDHKPGQYLPGIGETPIEIWNEIKTG